MFCSRRVRVDSRFPLTLCECSSFFILMNFFSHLLTTSCKAKIECWCRETGSSMLARKLVQDTLRCGSTRNWWKADHILPALDEGNRHRSPARMHASRREATAIKNLLPDEYSHFLAHNWGFLWLGGHVRSLSVSLPWGLAEQQLKWWCTLHSWLRPVPPILQPTVIDVLQVMPNHLLAGL